MICYVVSPEKIFSMASLVKKIVVMNKLKYRIHPRYLKNFIIKSFIIGTIGECCPCNVYFIETPQKVLSCVLVKKDYSVMTIKFYHGNINKYISSQ